MEFMALFAKLSPFFFSHKTKIFAMFSNLNSTLLLIALHIICISLFLQKFKSCNDERGKNALIGTAAL